MHTNSALLEKVFASSLFLTLIVIKKIFSSGIYHYKKRINIHLCFLTEYLGHTETSELQNTYVDGGLLICWKLGQFLPDPGKSGG